MPEPLKIICPECTGEIGVPPEFVGKLDCPKCGVPIHSKDAGTGVTWTASQGKRITRTAKADSGKEIEETAEPVSTTEKKRYSKTNVAPDLSVNARRDHSIASEVPGVQVNNPPTFEAGKEASPSKITTATTVCLVLGALGLFGSVAVSSTGAGFIVTAIFNPLIWAGCFGIYRVRVDLDSASKSHPSNVPRASEPASNPSTSQVVPSGVVSAATQPASKQTTQTTQPSEKAESKEPEKVEDTLPLKVSAAIQPVNKKTTQLSGTAETKVKVEEILPPPPNSAASDDARKVNKHVNSSSQVKTETSLANSQSSWTPMEIWGCSFLMLLAAIIIVLVAWMLRNDRIIFVDNRRPAGDDLNQKASNASFPTLDVLGEEGAVSTESERPSSKIAIRPPGTRLREEIRNSIGMQLKLLPAGDFLMGSPASEPGRENDESQHRVRITKPFYIQTTEVTQGQWQAVMGTTPWKRIIFDKTGSDYAASNISYDDALEFCRKLSSSENAIYRLPTEAEWEYACRGGKETAFSFGASSDELGSYAWFFGNSLDKGEQYAHRVGQKMPNGFGLYDMHGNNIEWCSDWYGKNYYQTSPSDDPTGPSVGWSRALRGGSWNVRADLCRSANRYRYSPSFRSLNLGFRVVRSSEE